MIKLLSKEEIQEFLKSEYIVAVTEHFVRNSRTNYMRHISLERSLSVF
jgi:hypothetical protein